jgi:hypothetical protein
VVGTAIPEDDPPAAQVPEHFAQKGDDCLGADGVLGVGVKVEPGASPPRRHAQGRHDRDLVAVIAVSSVALYELWYGVARSERRRENAERLRVFLSADIRVLPFNEEDAVAAGHLRALLVISGN